MQVFPQRAKSESVRSLVGHKEVHLHWTKPDTSIFDQVNLEIALRFSPAIFYRLLIPDELPESVERVLYLVSDLILNEAFVPFGRNPFGELRSERFLSALSPVQKLGSQSGKRLGWIQELLF